MVKRCLGSQCVDHPQNCNCPFCDSYKKQKSGGTTSVVTEQGMFGDLANDFEAVNDSSATEI